MPTGDSAPVDGVSCFTALVLMRATGRRGVAGAWNAFWSCAKACASTTKWRGSQTPDCWWRARWVGGKRFCHLLSWAKVNGPCVTLSWRWEEKRAVRMRNGRGDRAGFALTALTARLMASTSPATQSEHIDSTKLLKTVNQYRAIQRQNHKKQILELNGPKATNVGRPKHAWACLSRSLVWTNTLRGKAQLK